MLNVVVSYWNSTSNHNFDLIFMFSLLLYLIEILHQTTTEQYVWNISCRLYLIEILHQTTTFYEKLKRIVCCILLKFYIKPQLEPLIFILKNCCILLKFYIKPQRCLFDYCLFLCCILLKFYIKPQHEMHDNMNKIVVSYWNSTSNHNLTEVICNGDCCILLKFYIKPQLLEQFN